MGGSPHGSAEKPVVLITGATGNLGRSIAEHLTPSFRIVGLDRSREGDEPFPVIATDLTDANAIGEALDEVRRRFGAHVASVIHLAAYFDFTGEEHPLYDRLNVAGTGALLGALRERFTVEQFVYASTMLVHRPCHPGERISEETPIDPQWAYPRSKAKAERTISETAGDVPVVLLRLAGIYDEEAMVPTLAHQIARIADRELQSHVFPGNPETGQSMLHREDMLEAVRRTIDRRQALPLRTALLIGEPDALGYGELQNQIGRLLHGEEEWTTLHVPKPVAEVGAWLQDRVASTVPDTVAELEEPFVKPFMVRMGDDHYALDISRARSLLDWEPRHQLAARLPDITEYFKSDREKWEKRNLK